MKWPAVPIGEIVQVIGGGTPTRTKTEYYGGTIPWVTPKDMKFWNIKNSQINITQTGLDRSAARIAPESSVLIVVRSGVLKHTVPVGINRCPVAINQDMKALICSDVVFPDYLARFIKKSSSIVLGWVRATTAENFPIGNLKNLKIPLPPIEEQRRIASILDRSEDLRKKRQESIAHLESLIQSTFLSSFGDPSDEWPRLPVVELALPDKGSIRTGPFGSQLLHEEFTDRGIAVLGIDNAVKNTFTWGARRYISEEKYRQLVRYTVKPGDVLITIMGTCGRCAVVPDDIPVAINTKHLCCITLDQTRCLPQFLHSYFLYHPVAKEYLNRTAKGAIMAGLNMTIIKELPVLVPPLEQQREFVARLEAMRKIQAKHDRSLQSLETLFSSLQHRAFRGEL